MAKQPSAKGGMAHIRFVMLDAMIPEGDLSQVTQAIQNALKPAQVISQRTVIASSAQGSLPAPSSSAIENDEADVVDASDEEAMPIQPKKTREPRGKRVSSPEVVLDLDLNTEPSWVSYAEEKAPSSTTDRFLVVAEWCKRHRGMDEISADHVFTCFRRINWPTNIPDFASPLRGCKSRDYMSSGSQRSYYAINHLGSARVDELNKK